MTAVGAVNSREKADYLRISLRPPYIHLRLATAPPHRQDSVTFTHALYAPIPRRAARPASGFGSRGQAREAEEGGEDVEGAVAPSTKEAAVVPRQPPDRTCTPLPPRPSP